MIEYSKYAEVKAVTSAFEIDNLSRYGWCLLEIVPSTRVELVRIEKVRFKDNETPSPYGTSGQTYYENEAHVINQPIFMMGRVEGTVVAELQGKLDIEQQTRARADATAIENAKAATTAVEALGKANAAIRRHEEREAVEIQRTTDLRASVSKLERDIAKIRTAIGTGRMKEILGDMIYEVVNMSDAITIEADDPRVAMVVALLLGEGAYGLRTEDDGLVMPIMMFGPADRAEHWLADHGLPDVSAFLDAHKSEVSVCLESLVYCSVRDRLATIAVAKATGGDLRVGLAAWNEQKRTSLNDIAGRATELATALREQDAV